MPLPPPEPVCAPLGPDGTVPLGTVVHAPAANVAAALEGYMFIVDFAHPRGVSRQKIRFTGQATESGLEAMVVE